MAQLLRLLFLVALVGAAGMTVHAKSQFGAVRTTPASLCTSIRVDVRTHPGCSPSAVVAQRAMKALDAYCRTELRKLPNGARRVLHWRADATRLNCLKPSVRHLPCDALRKYTQKFAEKAPTAAYKRFGCKVNRLLITAAPANNSAEIQAINFGLATAMAEANKALPGLLPDSINIDFRRSLDVLNARVGIDIDKITGANSLQLTWLKASKFVPRTVSPDGHLHATIEMAAAFTKPLALLLDLNVTSLLLNTSGSVQLRLVGTSFNISAELTANSQNILSPCFSVDGLANLDLEIGDPEIDMPWLGESGLQGVINGLLKKLLPQEALKALQPVILALANGFLAFGPLSSCLDFTLASQGFTVSPDGTTWVCKDFEETPPANQYTAWMDNAVVRSKTLTQLAIPSTHDSGAYRLRTTYQPGGLYMGAGLEEMLTIVDAAGVPLQNVIMPWGITQRMLDLRAGVTNGIWVVHHTATGDSLDDILKQVARFLRANPTEVVTLDIRNFLNVAQDNAATTLHRMIQDNLGPYIWPCCNSSMTLGELQAKRYQAMVVIDDGSDFGNRVINLARNLPGKTYWSRSGDIFKPDSGYADSDNLERVVQYNREVVLQRFAPYRAQRSKTMALPWTMTPGGSAITTSLNKPTDQAVYHSLRNMADAVNPLFANFTKEMEAAVRDPFFIAGVNSDFFSSAQVAWAVQLSYAPL